MYTGVTVPIASRYIPISPFSAVAVTTVAGAPPAPRRGALVAVSVCFRNTRKNASAKIANTAIQITNLLPMLRVRGCGAVNWCSGPIVGCSFSGGGKAFPCHRFKFGYRDHIRTIGRLARLFWIQSKIAMASPSGDASKRVNLDRVPVQKSLPQ